jgi:DNA-binding CsgD family transcriptional regulator
MSRGNPGKEVAMSRSVDQRLVSDFAEMILSVRDPAAVWPWMLQKMDELIGFDSGYMAASWTTVTDGRGAVVGHDEPFMKRNLGRMLAEIAPEELARYADRASRAEDVWSSARRKQLSVFNEVLDPANVKKMLVRVSVRQGNVAGFNLERRGIAAEFSDRDLMLVDLVAPFLHMLEVLTLHSQDGSDQTNEFSDKHGLSPREAEFLDLTIRGLQNGEIAMLTGVSKNTVRNTLVKVYEKVGVTNRAELTFVARSPLSEDERRRPPTLGSIPDDGLSVFAKRVEAASLDKPGLNDTPTKSLFSNHRIVYSEGIVGPKGVLKPPSAGSAGR